MKVRGAQRRPMKKEREKLRVARVERVRPRRRRANDLIRRYCWETIGLNRPRPVESETTRIRGRTMFATRKV